MRCMLRVHQALVAGLAHIFHITQPTALFLFSWEYRILSVRLCLKKTKKVIIIIELPFIALPGALCKFFLLQFAQKHAMENICVYNALYLQICYFG